MNNKKEYETKAFNKAQTGLILRVLVSGYLVYLAWEIFSGMLSGESGIPDWGVWLICLVFVAVAVFSAVSAVKQFIRERKMAELAQNTESETDKDDQIEKND